MTRITVVTSVLNGVAGIRRTIESVLSQSYPSLEYVVIDGGSTDGTWEIVEEYVDSVDVMISQRDEGIAAGFNRGIEVASGDWVGIVSADDQLSEGSLRAVRAASMINPDADVIYGNICYGERGNHKKHVVRPDPDLRKVWTRQPLKHAGMFVSRRAYEAYGVYRPDLKYAMDYELVLRFSLAGAMFAYTDENLASVEGNGLSARHPIRTSNEVRRIALEYGGDSFSTNVAFVQKIGKLSVRWLLQRFGWHGPLNAYRDRAARFSRFDAQIGE